MSAPTNQHGQPKGFFNYRHNREKAVQNLHGILEGISADRYLTDPEIHYLQTWLADNKFIADDPDIRDLQADLSMILKDGVVAADERQDLLGVIDTILRYRGGAAQDERQVINTLQGFLSGIAADRALVDAEVYQLESWLDDHREFAASFPFDVILDRVTATLEDRHISEDERADLLETIDSLQGGSFLEIGAAGGLATRHTFDAPDILPHNRHVFCVTGKFAWGPRKAVERQIKTLGGKTAAGVSKKISYLLVGTFASRDWIGTSHGRKIEQAMEYRDKADGWPQIIAEEHWLTSFNTSE